MAILQLTAKQRAQAKYRAANKEKIAAAKRAWKKTPAGREAKQRERKTPAAAAADKRWKGKPETKAAKRARRKFSRDLRRQEKQSLPFVGCDGEGVGRGTSHRYVLFRMGDRELYRDGERLQTPDLLQFIVDHPRKSDVLVGFAFEYDVTNILLDVNPRDRKKLVEAYEQPADTLTGDSRKNPQAKEGQQPVQRPRINNRGSDWTWLRFPGYPVFGVNWLTKNHLSVCLKHKDPKLTRSSDTKSIRTIYDSFGFFQCSFVKALEDWKIGAEHLPEIKAQKDQRSSFTKITPEIRRYNALECELLADMMTKFRSTCAACDLYPKTPNGAGKIASYLHKQHGTITAKQLKEIVPAGVIRAAHAAYYGGRFEVTRAGRLQQPVWEHDINSAYPFAMLALPCLHHGTWHYTPGDQLLALLHNDPDCIFVAPAHFEHPAENFLCGLPFRNEDDGTLSWPRLGNGVYWSNELRSSLLLHADLQIRAGWLYRQRCDCRPFDWVSDLYAQRKALGDEQGKPIKLGINSLYGKVSQRIGKPPYKNPIWAGLITAATRAQLNQAIADASDVRNIAMMATDALYTVNEPLPYAHSSALGQWKIERHDWMFVVQPGLYWVPPTEHSTGIKSRGLAAKTLENYRCDFEQAWDQYAAKSDKVNVAERLEVLSGARRTQQQHLTKTVTHRAFPKVIVSFDAFIGLRLAKHWKQPKLAGTWQPLERVISFDWTGKRYPVPAWSPDRSHVVTQPLRGGLSKNSNHYTEDGTLESSAGWEEDRMLFDAMPEADRRDD